jgi:hypothetical protein
MLQRLVSGKHLDRDISRAADEIVGLDRVSRPRVVV